MRETTEKRFRQWCVKQNYFYKKISSMNDGGYKTKQETDFLVANKKGVYFVECKEVNTSRFEFSRLTQQLLIEHMLSRTNKIKQFILINFNKEKVLVMIEYTKFKKKMKNHKYKHFKLIDFDNAYKFDWKSDNILPK